MDCECVICGRKYIFDKKAGHTTKRCNSCMANHRRFVLKTRAIEYKGGKCIKCGYVKCIDALTFHHRNPKEKSFNISGSHTRKWSELQKELDKCDLLCHNCHAEEHWELFQKTRK